MSAHAIQGDDVARGTSDDPNVGDRDDRVPDEAVCRPARLVIVQRNGSEHAVIGHDVQGAIRDRRRRDRAGRQAHVDDSRPAAPSRTRTWPSSPTVSTAPSSTSGNWRCHPGCRLARGARGSRLVPVPALRRLGSHRPCRSGRPQAMRARSSNATRPPSKGSAGPMGQSAHSRRRARATKRQGAGPW